MFRTIPSSIPTLEDLEAPEIFKKIANAEKGLVLVTGPTGSGKSTTLAAIVDYINRNHNKHILTIEDPIEFVHNNNKCLINQREVHLLYSLPPLGLLLTTYPQRQGGILR